MSVSFSSFFPTTVALPFLCSLSLFFPIIPFITPTLPPFPPPHVHTSPTGVRLPLPPCLSDPHSHHLFNQSGANQVLIDLKY